MMMTLKKYIFPFLLVTVLLVSFLMKGKLNNYISVKMKESASAETALTGQQWVDSLFNYSKNKLDYEFTLIQFKSSGCNICKQMEPELENIRRDGSLNVNVTEIHIMNSNSQAVMQFYGISAVPAILILDKKGHEIFRKYGFVPAGELKPHFLKGKLNSRLKHP